MGKINDNFLTAFKIEIMGQMRKINEMESKINNFIVFLIIFFRKIEQYSYLF